MPPTNLKFNSTDPYLFLTPWEISQVQLRHFELQRAKGVDMFVAFFDTPKGNQYCAVRVDSFGNWTEKDAKAYLIKRALEGYYENSVLRNRRVEAQNTSTGRTAGETQGTR